MDRTCVDSMVPAFDTTCQKATQGDPIAIGCVNPAPGVLEKPPSRSARSAFRSNRNSLGQVENACGRTDRWLTLGIGRGNRCSLDLFPGSSAPYMREGVRRTR